MKDNPGIGLVHTGAVMVDERRRQRTLVFPVFKEGEDIAKWIFEGTYNILTCTVLMRRALLQRIYEECAEDFSCKYQFGDMQTWFHSARLAGIHCLAEDYGTYRFHDGSVSSYDNLLKHGEFYNSVMLLRKHLQRKYDLSVASNIGWTLRYLRGTIWFPPCETNLPQLLRFCLMQQSLYAAIAVILLLLRPFRSGKWIIGKSVRYAINWGIIRFCAPRKAFGYSVSSDL
jgi:hypothetical protein